MTEADRGERSHVEYPAAVWTSFDRYSRYGLIARTVRSCLGPGRHRVLDVGESSGYLTLFDPDLPVVGVDVVITDAPLAGAVRVAGDGRCLPFPDRAFDAVISSDTLEHIPADGRPDFLGELARERRDVVVVAAPFDTPGVAGAEELVRRFALLATGAPQAQLDEHRDYVLPGLDEAEKALRDRGFEVGTWGSGNLYDWLLMMLVKYQLGARPALAPLVDGYDILYNAVLAGRNDVPPYYRHVVAGRRFGQVEVAPGPAVIDGTPPDLSGLLAGLLAANVAEAARQDATPRLDGLLGIAGDLQRRIDEVAARQDEFAERVDTLGARAGQIEAALPDILERLGHIRGQLDAILGPFAQLRHPIRTLQRKHRPGGRLT